MNRQHSTKTLVVISISLMLLTASATFLLSFFLFNPMDGTDAELRAELARLWEVRAIIADRYVGSYEESDLTEAALIATVNALGDRWSHYLTPEQHEAQLRRTGNRYPGIGINILRCEESYEVLIAAVGFGSPAEEAGLQPGEFIASLQGRPTPELEIVEIQQIVAAQYGNYVTLEIRNETGELRTVRVYVREIYVNPVSYEMIEDGIGYIRIINFDRGSSAETLSAIDSLLEAGAQGLIFDVRRNPGGLLAEFLSILDHFLPEKEIFIYEDQDGIHIRHSSPGYFKLPMVILVDEDSFSAAELFAAVLQEYDWARVVGTSTTGKSRVQQTIPLSNGSGLHLSVSRYLTPGRIDLYEAGGIQPDYVIERQAGEVDHQLEKALELLR